MKFSIEREDYLKPLQDVLGAVERKQTMPILGNVLIEATDSSLILTASDSEIELQSSIQLPEGSQPGAVTVPARKMHDICRSLPDHARIDCELSGEQLKVKSGRSRFTLSTLPAAEFPKSEPLENAQTVILQQSDLLQTIRSTAFSMAQQDVRFYLNGMLMEIGQERLCCVATDGHRLAYSESTTEASPDEPIRAIVPRKSVNELTKLLGSSLGEVTLSLSENYLKIIIQDVILTTKLIDGRFPDYNRVIPIDVDKELLLDRDSLRDTLQRAAILSSEKYRGVRLAVESGVLTVSSNNPEREEAIDELEVDYAGQSAEIGFNVTYLLDVLAAMDGENARILLKDSNSSALVMPEANDSTKYVIMPMRL